MTDSRTLEQRVLAQALREKPCQRTHPAVGTDNHPYHGDGTPCAGQVAEFPMLQAPCPCLHHRFADKDSYEARHHSGYCTGNLCLGWLPVTTTDALLEACHQVSITVQIDHYTDGRYPGKEYQVTIFPRGRPTHGVGSFLDMALALALEAALEAAVGGT